MFQMINYISIKHNNRFQMVWIIKNNNQPHNMDRKAKHKNE